MSDLDKTFAKAAEIAQKLPENLQEAAFNRALDELLGKSSQDSVKNNRRDTPNNSKSKQSSDKLGGRQNYLIDNIDRTKYTDIGATERIADRALKVLQLATEDYSIDGLTASQISEILTKKFRLPAKKKAVHIALLRESKTVDVQKGTDGTNLFRIMEPGEKYLESLRVDETELQTQNTKKIAKKKEKKKPAALRKTAKKKKTGSKSAKRKSAALGPKAAIGKLIQAGYFSSPRLLSEIQEELKHSKGHTFSVQELSPALVRCIRDETLSRSRNDSGQYEYSKP